MAELEAAELVTVCGDPGGAAALVPVLRYLSERGLRLSNFCYGPSAQILARENVPHSLVPDDANEAWVTEALKGARSLLVATSHNERNWEKLFVSSAKRLGIPSLAVLDFWSSYAERFSAHGRGLEFLPDRIAVMDEGAKREITAVGVPASIVRVTGQPAFETASLQRSAFTSEKRAAFRKNLALDEPGLLLLFASQPLKQVFGDVYGFTELTVLRTLITTLEKIAESTEAELTLLVRPHPRESVGDFASLTSERIRILVSGAGSNPEAILSSDLVLGMNSAFLVESCLLGMPTVSLQPGLRREDPLPTNRLGASLGLYSESEMPLALERLIEDERERSALKAKAEKFKASFAMNATANIAEEVMKQWRAE